MSEGAMTKRFKYVVEVVVETSRVVKISSLKKTIEVALPLYLIEEKGGAIDIVNGPKIIRARVRAVDLY